MKISLLTVMVHLLLASGAAQAGDTTGARISCNTVGNEISVNLTYSYFDLKDYELKARHAFYPARARYLTALWDKSSELKFAFTIEPDATTNKLFVYFESSKESVRPNGKTFFEGRFKVFDRAANTEGIFEGGCLKADGGNEI